jgi:uncharacterized protein YpuA (DUF1002 family)
MVFDLVSFVVGVGAGALTGILAGVLRSLEQTADLQERLLRVSQEVKHMKELSENCQRNSRMDDLDHDLAEIHEEIRRMYKRSTR